MRFILLILILFGSFLAKAVEISITQDVDNVEYKTMVVEGRTWWYSGEQMGPNEFGVRIAGEVEIDGVKWHAIEAVLHHKMIEGREGWDNPYVDFTQEWVKYNPGHACLGFIREENRKVSFMEWKENDKFNDDDFNSATAMYGMPTFSVFSFGSSDQYDCYDFGVSEGSFSLNTDDETPDEKRFLFNVTANDTIVSHGNAYPAVKVSLDPKSLSYQDSCADALIVQGIGIVCPSDSKDYESHLLHAESMFWAPYPQYMTQMGSVHGCLLRYVTDQDNNIIFEHAGGEKLWESYEKYNSVSNIRIDTAGNPLYYNLQGQPVDKPVPGNIYIVRTGSRVSKLYVH